VTAHVQRLRRSNTTRRPTAGLVVRYGLIVLLVALVIAFSVLRPSFISPENLTGLLRSACIAMIMFLGLTWVLAAGEIDVSFVSIAALANMIVAGLVAAGHGWPLAMLAALTASLLVGAVNGLLVGYFGLPALVITIATGGVASALAAAVGLGSSIAITDTGFMGVAVESKIGVIPAIAIIVLAAYGAAWCLQERLTFGHYVYALAQNRRAVIEAGVPARKLLALLFLAAALTSGVAGILLTADLSSGQPSTASSFFLYGLTSVLLGSMVIKFGKPNVIGTAIGVLILAVLVRGGALMGWDDSKFEIVQGCLLLVGIAIVVHAREHAIG
jgi:ribose transport system permease protein